MRVYVNRPSSVRRCWSVCFVKEVEQMTNLEADILARVVIDPRVMVGKPVIRGTRLTVDYILNLLGHGATTHEIVEEYEGLTADDIRACILFAARSLADTDFLPASPGTV